MPRLSLFSLAGVVLALVGVVVAWVTVVGVEALGLPGVSGPVAAACGWAAFAGGPRDAFLRGASGAVVAVGAIVLPIALLVAFDAPVDVTLSGGAAELDDLAGLLGAILLTGAIAGIVLGLCSGAAGLAARAFAQTAPRARRRLLLAGTALLPSAGLLLLALSDAIGAGALLDAFAAAWLVWALRRARTAAGRQVAAGPQPA